MPIHRLSNEARKANATHAGSPRASLEVTGTMKRGPATTVDADLRVIAAASIHGPLRAITRTNVVHGTWSTSRALRSKTTVPRLAGAGSLR